MRSLMFVLVGLLVAGCGGGSDVPAADKPATSSTTPAPVKTTPPKLELENAVRAYSKAFLSGDGAAAYGLLSARCRDRLALSDFAAQTEQAKAQYGPLPIKSLKMTVNGDQAQVTYTYSDHSIDQTREPWVRESGQWREDDC